MSCKLSNERNRARLAPATKPVLEALEQRTMMSVSVEAGVLSIAGTSGADAIRVTPARKTGMLRVTVNGSAQLVASQSVQSIRIQGGAGDDLLELAELNGNLTVPAILSGGPGNDSLSGAAGNDRLRGGEGDDLLFGGEGNDYMRGHQGDDRLVGGKGDDLMRGGVGHDYLTIGAGEDQVLGGAGQDSTRAGFVPNFSVATYTSQPGTGYTPAQIRTAYGFGDLTNDDLKIRGQGEAMVIITAFHAPLVARDLSTFSREYELLKPTSKNFQVVYASGKRPLYDEDWAAESALDTQWAHAIAPNAKLYLMEADSDSPSDLFVAFKRAIDLLNQRHHGGVISASLGAAFGFGGESVDDLAFDALFGSSRAKNVSIIMSAGDNVGDVNGPSTSPNVTAVGGTKLFLDELGDRVPGVEIVGLDGDTLEPVWGNDLPTTGFGDCEEALPLTPGGEAAYWLGPGGISNLYPTPVYQYNRPLPDAGRAIPDLAYVADPRTGVNVYTSSGVGGQSGWVVGGGTSVGAPQVAALVVLANQMRREVGRGVIGNTLQERIYRLGDRGPDQFFNDITVHGNGPLMPPDGPCPDVKMNFINPAFGGWDFATGWGSPNARSLIPALADIKFKKPTNLDVKFTGRYNRNFPILPVANNGGGGGATGGGGGAPFGGGGTVGNDPGGGPAPGEGLVTIGFKGNSSADGFYTVNLHPVRMRQFYTLPGSVEEGSIYTLNIYGADPNTGVASPMRVDPDLGFLVDPGTDIILSRNGNALSGWAHYTFTQDPVSSSGGAARTVLGNGRMRITGTVTSNGIEGKFQSITFETKDTPDNVFSRGIGNDPLIAGTFKDA